MIHKIKLGDVMITTIEMRKLEEKAEKNGVSKLVLMERAGEGILKIIEKKYGLDGKKFLVVCYHGNNGGDGFVVARFLLGLKEDCNVLFIGDEDRLKKEGLENLDALKFIDHNKGIIIRDIDLVDFGKYDIIIDAMLGTGTDGGLSGVIKDSVERINLAKEMKSEIKVVSVDVPTGTNPDTGKCDGVCVEADLIVCMHDIKKGLVAYKDKVEIVDIGL